MPYRVHYQYNFASKLTRALCFVLLLSLFSGCSVFDSDADQIVDDYEISWIDLAETRALRKGEQLVPPYVFEVGYDSKFIFAKRYGLVLIDREQCVDQSVVYYYIIERTKSSFQDKPVYGPLSKEGFLTKCTALGVKNPKFERYPLPLFLKYNVIARGKHRCGNPSGTGYPYAVCRLNGSIYLTGSN